MAAKPPLGTEEHDEDVERRLSNSAIPRLFRPGFRGHLQEIISCQVVRMLFDQESQEVCASEAEALHRSPDFRMVPPCQRERDRFPHFVAE